ncbi:hypothetical protein BDZ45DRAFT_720448 [Acephala macrosclerotiorum]|nr:hypothetical protein BDZ45DRAFT_720448 [Acephala macrosclerotiorum]
MAPQTQGFFAGYDTEEKMSMRRMVLAGRYWWAGGRSSNSAYLYGLTNQQLVTLEVIRAHAEVDETWHQLVKDLLNAPRMRKPSQLLAIVKAMERHVENIQVPLTQPITSLLITPQPARHTGPSTTVSSNANGSNQPRATALSTLHSTDDGQEALSLNGMTDNTGDSPSSKVHSEKSREEAPSLALRVPATEPQVNMIGLPKTGQPTPDYFNQSFFHKGQSTYSSPYGQMPNSAYGATSLTSQSAVSSLSHLAAGQTANLSALNRISQVDGDRLMALSLQNQPPAFKMGGRGQIQPRWVDLSSSSYYRKRAAKAAQSTAKPAQSTAKPAQSTHGHPVAYASDMAALNRNFDFADQQLEKEREVRSDFGLSLAVQAAIDEEERQFQQALANSLVEAHGGFSATVESRPKLSKRPPEDAESYLPPAKRINNEQDRLKTYNSEGYQNDFIEYDNWSDDASGVSQFADADAKGDALAETDSCIGAEGEMDPDVDAEGDMSLGADNSDKNEFGGAKVEEDKTLRSIEEGSLQFGFLNKSKAETAWRLVAFFPT